MRVCIVGGGGYLGCELAARLQSHGAHTVILDVSFAGHPSIQLDERLTTRIQVRISAQHGNVDDFMDLGFSSG
ncbi:hypothetical protein Y032_0065g3683 [Ancylostoma ceylanicum]|uniref:NAD-dependent epimerase/dehydratase domain-containing protein n=1 Tax=Ancylostoma ceylanicum TaxID=53326 RepID=A0A016U256_9BILA|nr:hypothetical protein Y032_0065g3683 [Ancylostoma ceylanicum]